MPYLTAGVGGVIYTTPSYKQVAKAILKQIRPRECRIPAIVVRFLSGLKGTSLLSEVLRYTRERFEWKEDEGLLYYPEEIKSPVDFLRDKTGDCDDYAVFQCSLLSHLGFKAGVVIGENRIGKGHAWIVLFLGGEEYHIDPHSGQMFLSRYPGYTPLYFINRKVGVVRL